jgi:gliding motility-associated-like protein
MGNDPSPIYAVGASAGIYSATPVGLAFVNLNTGEINLALSTPGTYTVTNTIPVSGTCAATSATTTITINPSDDASFVYTSGTYCQSGANPTPTITGLPGGSFSATPAGLSINPATGTINLATSLLGIYTLTYTTNGICPNTRSITMTIGNTTPSANFNYTGSSFCPSGNNPFPIFASGASAGVFSATPAGLVFVNANTGQINLALSTPGTYTVSNTIPASGTCLAATDSSIITIALDNASFAYATTTYCQSGGNPAPTITGLPGGVFSSTPVGLTIDPATGTINLSTSTLGIYTISYTTNGACPNTSSVTITIGNTAPSASFTANPTTGEAPLTVNFTNNSTSATHYLWQFGTGDSSLVANPTYIYVPTGNFTVCLTAYNDGGCWDTACSTIDVYINSAIVIPNVFTPNGDGINDVFSIKTKGLATFNAQIFSRWGELVYEWHTIEGGWDGYSASGILSSSGTYYYVIKATGLDAKDYLEKGSFSLLRENK